MKNNKKLLNEIEALQPKFHYKAISESSLIENFKRPREFYSNRNFVAGDVILFLNDYYVHSFYNFEFTVTKVIYNPGDDIYYLRGEIEYINDSNLLGISYGIVKETIKKVWDDKLEDDVNIDVVYNCLLPDLHNAVLSNEEELERILKEYIKSIVSNEKDSEIFQKYIKDIQRLH